MPCRFPVGSPSLHPGGKLRGLARGVSRPTLGEVPGPYPGCLQVHTRGGFQIHTQGGLQAHTWGVSTPTPRGLSPGPHPEEGSPGPHPGGPPGPHPEGRGCVSQHALRQTPLWMATATGSMHPTGMHSYFSILSYLYPL